MAKSKENEKLLELGSKQRAGRLLSNYLRAIADEKTELVDVVVSPDKTERRLVSKAEAIARDMFRIALPKSVGDCSLTPVTDDKIQLEYRKMILDRIDGKPGAEDNESPKDSIPDRISDINKQRVNRMANEVMGEDS